MADAIEENLEMLAVAKSSENGKPVRETLAACTDKTGTLTENRMVVKRIWTAYGTTEPDAGPAHPDGGAAERGDDRL